MTAAGHALPRRRSGLSVARASASALPAYDIAKLIGADTTLPLDLVHGLWDEIAPGAEGWRNLGVYGPAVPLREDAPLQERLLRLTGRQPT